MQYTTNEAVNSELFGRRGTAAIVDLPSNLEYFTSVLPRNDCYSIETIVNKHSLAPFYSPFIPTDRFERLCYNMSSSGGGAVHNICGVTATKVRTPRILRYCPLCARADKEQFGECYWHRLHQVPGVKVCPTHHLFLEDSSAVIRHRLSDALYLSAEEAIRSKPPRPIELGNSLHSGLINLARNVSWLLDQWNLSPGFNTLRSAYLNLLTDQNLTYQGWKVRSRDLVKLFNNTYDVALLQTLQCSVDENKRHNWLSCLVKHLGVNKVAHPLRHLLLIQLLGHTSESFFTLCATHKPITFKAYTEPFRCGPYPCLNPVCKHFRQRVIADKVVKYRGRRRPPSAIFTCTCGYSYMRNGAHKAPDDLYRRDHVMVYGDTWEAALRTMWSDRSLSIHTIAKRLSVAHNTAKYQAVTMGLRFPRQGPGNKIATVEAHYQKHLRSIRSKRLKRSSPKTQKRILICYREKWRSVLRELTEANRTQLQRAAPAVYGWLKLNDRSWLQANMPPRWKRTESARQINWTTRDLQVAREVRLVVDRIKNIDGLPIRIRKGTIARYLRQDVITRAASLRRLPLTAQTLREVTESRVEFSIRRVSFAITQLENERKAASYSAIGLRARLDWNMWYVPQVKAVIEAGVFVLSNFRE